MWFLARSTSSDGRVRALRGGIGGGTSSKVVAMISEKHQHQSVRFSSMAQARLLYRRSLERSTRHSCNGRVGIRPTAGRTSKGARAHVHRQRSVAAHPAPTVSHRPASASGCGRRQTKGLVRRLREAAPGCNDRSHALQWRLLQCRHYFSIRTPIAATDGY